MPILVSAAHLFKRMSGDSAVIVLRRAQADGTYLRSEVAVPIRAGGADLWTTHPKYDVAALRIALPADAQVDPIPFAALAAEDVLRATGLHAGGDLRVLGYPPSSRPTRPDSPSSATPRWPASRSRRSPSIRPSSPTSPPPRATAADRSSSPTRPPRPAPRLMLAEVVQATFIRETIALLPKD
jgi:hypothetical protein